MDDTLSIVIPAFRARYLCETLDSLSCQTDSSFEVIIGDDASTDSIEAVVNPYRKRLQVRYHRFDVNLGANHLTRHWDRCIAMASGSWLMLLGDDDCLDPECIASFRTEIGSRDRRHDVYRFNTRWIDAESRIIRSSPVHPATESWDDYLLAKLKNERYSFTCDHIFSRDSYGRAGGFVELPIAWCADDASWISFAAEKGFRTIQGPMASWRRSGTNISSDRPELRRTKLIAMACFVEWLQREMSSGHLVPGRGCQTIEAAARSWFFDRFWERKSPLTLMDCLTCARKISSMSYRGYPRNLARLVLHTIRT